jgi:succinate dehydrogenase / fumarate reductase, cytochrome b subunit
MTGTTGHTTGQATPRPRPLSPHLQIYRPQLTSILSITHRATGIANAAGTLLLVYWLVAAAQGPAAFADAQALIGSWFGMLVLLGWSVALFYHLGNGVRHLAWDAGYGFDLKTVYASGYAVLAFTVVATAIAWAIGLTVMAAR